MDEEATTSSKAEGPAESKIAEGLKAWQERAEAHEEEVHEEEVEEEAPEQQEPEPQEPEEEEAINAAPDEDTVQEPSVEEPPEELTEEQIDRLLNHKKVQSKVYQLAQSMKDKELHQERLRRQQQEEEERLARMDNAELGEYVREQREQGKVKQQAAQQVQRQVVEKMLADMQERALDQISDEELREDMRRKSMEFKTFPEFFGACVQAEAEHRATQQLTEREKELRESIRKEVQAEQSNQLYPQLGRGVPADQRREVPSGQDAIAEGFAKALDEVRKKR